MKNYIYPIIVIIIFVCVLAYKDEEFRKMLDISNSNVIIGNIFNHEKKEQLENKTVISETKTSVSPKINSVETPKSNSIEQSKKDDVENPTTNSLPSTPEPEPIKEE